MALLALPALSLPLRPSCSARRDQKLSSLAKPHFERLPSKVQCNKPFLVSRSGREHLLFFIYFSILRQLVRLVTAGALHRPTGKGISRVARTGGDIYLLTIRHLESSAQPHLPPATSFRASFLACVKDFGAYAEVVGSSKDVGWAPEPSPLMQGGRMAMHIIPATMPGASCATSGICG